MPCVDAFDKIRASKLLKHRIYGYPINPQANFFRKKYDSLHVTMDYQGLNKVIIENRRYSLLSPLEYSSSGGILCLKARGLEFKSPNMYI